MRRVLVPVLILPLLAATVFAAEHLTLREAMEQARAQAREVAAARARSAAAGEQLRQAKGFRLPSVELQEMWVRTDSPAEAFAFKLNQERFSFSDFVAGDPNNPDFLNTAVTRLQVSLPLFTGGELSGRIAQADLAAKAAADDAAWAGNQAAMDAARAYVMLAQAEEYETLLQRSRDTVQAHVELARNYVGQGMIVRSELLRAEVELSRVEDMLEEAHGRVMVANANLAYRLGTNQDTVWTLAALPAPAAVQGDLGSWLATAADRKDLVAARQKLQAGELEERVRRAAYYPTVGLVAHGDLVDDTLFGSHGRSTTVMAVAKINLFAGGSDRAAVAAARFQAEAGRHDVARFEEGVRLQVRKAYEDAVTARSRYATAAKALDAAREVERITQQRFKSGVVKMLDLVDATTARREAETRELVARAKAQEAALELATAAGRTPESVLP